MSRRLDAGAETGGVFGSVPTEQRPAFLSPANAVPAALATSLRDHRSLGFFPGGSDIASVLEASKPGGSGPCPWGGCTSCRQGCRRSVPKNRCLAETQEVTSERTRLFALSPPVFSVPATVFGTK